MGLATDSLPAVLFDLDGTLVDTAHEIADAVNDLLQELGRPRVSDERVLQWIGEGLPVLLARALAHSRIPETEVGSLWPRFAMLYGDRCGQRSVPYPGIHAALDRLRAHGTRLAVVTNKDSIYTERILAKHALREFFSLVVAGDTLLVKKPDPAVIRHALSRLGTAQTAALLIGDSVIDVRAARAAAIPIWAVRHGYHQGLLIGADAPDRFIEHFDQLALPDPAASTPPP